MQVAKTRLVFDNKDKIRTEINAGTEITKDLGIPDDVMSRFKKLGAVGEKTAEEKVVEARKAEENAKAQAEAKKGNK